MPQIASAVRTIQVRPSRNPRWQKQGGWEVFEAEGVSPVYCGATAREYALSYARQRTGYAPTRIQVLDAEGMDSKLLAAIRGRWFNNHLRENSSFQCPVNLLQGTPPNLADAFQLPICRF
jgi:hypothetical protein